MSRTRLTSFAIAICFATSLVPARGGEDLRELIRRTQPSILQLLPAAGTDDQAPRIDPNQRPFPNPFQNGTPNLNSLGLGWARMSPMSFPLHVGLTAFAIGSDLVVASNVGEGEATFLDESGNKWSGQVIARDQVTGLAVIRIAEANLPPLAMAVEPAVPGTELLVVSWSADAPTFASAMIASGLRTDHSRWGLTQSLDVQLGMESWGAPVIDAQGSLVGIVVLAEGEARVVPVPQIARLVEAASGDKAAGAESKVTLHRGRLGIQIDDHAGHVEVGRVMEGTPAADSSFQPGDVIVEVNGRKCRSAVDVMATINSSRGGDVVRVLVQRGDESIEQTVTLAATPEPETSADVLGFAVPPVQGNAFSFRNGRVVPIVPGQNGIDIQLFQQDSNSVDLGGDRDDAQEVIRKLNERIQELEKALQEATRADE